MTQSSQKTMKLEAQLLEALACELSGGEKYFYEYPNNDHDRRRYREQAGKLLSVIYSKLRQEDAQTVIEYGMSILLTERTDTEAKH